MNNNYRVIILKGSTPICEGFIEDIALENNELLFGHRERVARMTVIGPNLSDKAMMELLTMIDIPRVYHNNIVNNQSLFDTDKPKQRKVHTR